MDSPESVICQALRVVMPPWAEWSVKRGETVTEVRMWAPNSGRRLGTYCYSINNLELLWKKEGPIFAEYLAHLVEKEWSPKLLDAIKKEGKMLMKMTATSIERVMDLAHRYYCRLDDVGLETITLPLKSKSPPPVFDDGLEASSGWVAEPAIYQAMRAFKWSYEGRPLLGHGYQNNIASFFGLPFLKSNTRGSGLRLRIAGRLGTEISISVINTKEWKIEQFIIGENDEDMLLIASRTLRDNPELTDLTDELRKADDRQEP